MERKILSKITPAILKILYGNIIKILKNIDDKNLFNYEESFHNRISLISRSVIKYDLEKCQYLEIGVESNIVFNSIPLINKNKTGVDPVRGGTHRMTSDVFFKENNQTFDIIFIDGLHHYSQVLKDLKNSLDCLNEGGIIFIHDMIPRSEAEQIIPRIQFAWTGDPWKLSYNLKKSKNIDFIIANIDRGVGIIKPNQNFNLYDKEDNFKDKTFKDLKLLYNELPIKSVTESFEFIDSLGNNHQKNKIK